MRSVMKHSFSEVPRANIPRSSFNRSHGYKTTFDADLLIPVFLDDVVPGDTFNLDMNFFARLATPLFPLMDNLRLESFFFFVPYRLLWTNWEKMHGAQDDPDDSIDYTVPVVTGAYSVETGDLGDYMGLPLGLNFNTTTDISALPFRAYQLIWNEWFRDQNLQDSQVVATGDGPDSAYANLASLPPLKRGKRHDYFTSCLPWPQKGDAVVMPLGDEARIWTDGVAGNIIEIGDEANPGDSLRLNGLNPTQLVAGSTSVTPTLYADLSSATAATINDLRLAFQTQRLLERDARSGTRYNELILSHFGVTVPDFRVQRPEFLGGGSDIVQITPVASTSDGGSGGQNEVGDLAAFGTASGRHGFTKSFTEHGLILGMVNVRGDITYSQGVERYWTKQTRYDFFYPVLAQIGEQSVLNKEIWHDSAGTNNEDVFGYQERYAEYRYKPSRITGKFRPDATGTLAAWHLSEDFASLPTLGSSFIESNTGVPLDRAIAVPSEPHIIFDSYFNLQCARPMPLFGVPGNLDHF